MSQQYSDYIYSHKDYVRMAFEWLLENTPEIFDDELFKAKCFNLIRCHDESKMSADEYDAYDAYFYGNERTKEIEDDFNRAWLMHIHRNPHHWQYWILINDDPEEGDIILDMPNQYIIEMICDWWSFSWKKGDLYEIFNWYEKRKDHIKLSYITRVKVEGLLALMHCRLLEQKSDVNE